MASSSPVAGVSTPRFTLALLHPRYWSEWAGLFGLMALSLLPRAWRRRLAVKVGAWQYQRNHKRRRYAAINLQRCFPEMPEAQREQLAQQHFQVAVQALFDLPLLMFASARRLQRMIQLDGLTHLQDLQAQGEKIIFLTCHSLALEAGGKALHLAQPVHAYYNPFKSAFGDWWMYRLRSRFGVRMSTREQGLRGIVKAVRGGEALYYFTDEDLGRDNSAFVPFFAEQKATLTSLGRLAQLCQAKVLPCYSWYDADADRYRVSILPALEDFPGPDELVNARRMNASIEALILLHPQDYMWTLRLFKTRPNGERSPYKKPKTLSN